MSSCVVRLMSSDHFIDVEAYKAHLLNCEACDANEVCSEVVVLALTIANDIAFPNAMSRYRAVSDYPYCACSVHRSTTASTQPSMGFKRCATSKPRSSTFT